MFEKLNVLNQKSKKLLQVLKNNWQGLSKRVFLLLFCVASTLLKPSKSTLGSKTDFLRIFWPLKFDI